MNNLLSVRFSLVLSIVLIPFTFASFEPTPDTPSAVRLVSTAGTDAGTCEFFPCATIAYAINQSASNDTIQVAAGTYTEAGITIDNNITIIGEGADKTIVQAGATPPASDRVFYIDTGHNVRIQGITIRNGYITGRGGGIRVDGSSLTLIEVTVDNNTSSNTISGDGGGIYVREGGLGMEGCTLSNNFASGGGGGIYLYYSSASMVNTTFSGNRANKSGGAIGTLSDDPENIWLYYITIYDNSVRENGGGMQLESRFSAYILNSIVAGNNAGMKGPDIFGEIISQDYNLIGNTSDATIAGSTTHNITGQDAKLGSLQNNGGSTLTHALLQSSPAIDAAICRNPLHDQRDQIRPIDKPEIVNVADGCDIGAYEDSLKVNLPLVMK